jgi:hypothetical protein
MKFEVIRVGDKLHHLPHNIVKVEFSVARMFLLVSENLLRIINKFSEK